MGQGGRRRWRWGGGGEGAEMGLADQNWVRSSQNYSGQQASKQTHGEGAAGINSKRTRARALQMS